MAFEKYTYLFTVLTSDKIQFLSFLNNDMAGKFVTMKKGKHKNEVNAMKNIITLLSLLLLLGAQANAQSIYYDSITINNISAGFNADGSLFWDFNNNSHFRAPKAGQANTIFVSALWLGGIDAGGNLHTAAQTYRQSGTDFWPGPLDSSGTTTQATSDDWNYIWNVTRADINQHIYDFADNGIIDGPIPNVILTWPALGSTNAKGANNASLSVTQDMAPFIDINGDGIYTPTLGDYPDIKGDQALWWVFNDTLDQHTETGGLAIGLQIRTMVYAYTCTGDSTLDNTLFLQYDITNKSTNNYSDFYASMWTDFDYGCFNNDYVGSNPALDFFYGYNGTATDPDCATTGFGLEVGTMAVSILEGLKDTQGTNIGLSSFIKYNNDFTIMGNPSSFPFYYSYMKGSWKDGSPITSDRCNGYGGSVVTKYMFPDEPGGASFPTTWSECSCNNSPADRRGMGTTGPGNLASGETVRLTYAFGNYNISTQVACNANRPDSQVQHLQDLFANGFQTACTSCIGDTCVWPGDVNSDGVANNFDILELGIAASSTGPTRPNASILWQGQSGPVWSNLFANGVNYQHADCDGNGTVDFDDVLPINVNYGFTHLKTDATAKASAVDPTLFVNGPNDTMLLNSNVVVPIHLGTAANPADNVYGLAFTFNLDASLVKPGSVTVEFDSCWLGDAGVDVMTVSKYFNDGHLEIGLSRTNGQGTSAYGNIATVHFITTDNLSGKNEATTMLPMSISNVKVINAQEQVIPVNLGFDTLIIVDRIGGIGDIDISLDANIYPNPTNNEVNITLPSIKQGSAVEVSIFNTLGNQFGEYRFPNQVAKTISLDTLPAGVYYITITAEGKTISKRLLVF